MLFKEVDDCDICPFSADGDNPECCAHNNPDGYHPCEYTDELGNMEVEEVVEVLQARLFAEEECRENKWLKEQEVKEKNKAKQEKREQTRWQNRDLNNELTRIRRKIRAKRSLLSSMRAMLCAFVTAEELVNRDKVELPKAKHPLELEIEQLEKRVIEISAEKKSRRSKK